MNVACMLTTSFGFSASSPCPSSSTTPKFAWGLWKRLLSPLPHGKSCSPQGKNKQDNSECWAVQHCWHITTHCQNCTKTYKEKNNCTLTIVYRFTNSTQRSPTAQHLCVQGQKTELQLYAQHLHSLEWDQDPGAMYSTLPLQCSTVVSPTKHHCAQFVHHEYCT